MKWFQADVRLKFSSGIRAFLCKHHCGNFRYEGPDFAQKHNSCGWFTYGEWHSQKDWLLTLNFGLCLEDDDHGYITARCHICDI